MNLDKIFDKLGIYGFIGVIIPGLCITLMGLISFFILGDINFINSKIVDVLIKINPTMLFLVTGYFVGIIFQEFGYFVYHKKILKNEKLLMEVLHGSIDTRYSLSKSEYNIIRKFVTNKFNDNNLSDREIYNYCKHEVSMLKSSYLYDKNQSLSAMARSFSCYFALSGFVFLGFSINYIFFTYLISKSILCILLSITSFFLTYLMFYRCIRFSKLRFKNILSSYYYAYIINDDKKNI